MRKSKREIERFIDEQESDDDESIPVRISRNRVNDSGEIVERNEKEILL